MAEWSKAHAWKVCRRGTVSRVRIPLAPPLRYKTGNADFRRFPSLSGYQRPQQGAFAAFDVDCVVRDLDALREFGWLPHDGGAGDADVGLPAGTDGRPALDRAC